MPATAATSGPLPQEGPSGLPNGRAYELVSPPNKNDVDIAVPMRRGGAVSDGAPGFYASRDGQGVLFDAAGGFPGSTSVGGLGFAQYKAIRTDEGWTTTPITPPAVTTPAPTIGTGETQGITDDFGRSFLYSPQALVPGAPVGQNNIYVRDSGGTSLLTPTLGVGAALLGPTSGPAAFMPFLRGMSEDLTTGLFQSTDGLFPGAGMFSPNLYAWDENGPRLVAADADAGRGANASMLFNPIEGRSNRRSVSADGRVIAYTTSLSNNPQVYVEVDGGAPVHVSAPQGGPTAPNSRVGSFQQMTRTGDTVFFTSTGALTSDGFEYPAPTSNANIGDLYAYDVVAGTLRNLTPASDAGPSGARVQEVVAMSDDGSTLFFVALGVINGEGTEAQNSLFMHRDGETRRIASVFPTGTPNEVLFRATDDGRYLAFADARTSIDGYDSGSLRMVYRYDVVADELKCVSCRPDGTSPTDHAAMAMANFSGPAMGTLAGQRTRTMSEDGRRVFFSSSDALVSGAVNGTENVYLWEDGVLSLISPGTGENEALLFGTTPSGDDVFFSTRDQLVGWDVDGNVDLYTARVGGGFPEPETDTEPPCVGDACQGDLLPPLEVPQPGTTIPGLGNVVPPADPPARAAAASISVRALSSSARRQLAAGRTARVPVRVTGGGTLNIRATARVANRNRTVATARRTVKQTRAVTANVPIRLSSAARRDLARGRTLTVRIRVTSSRTDRAQTRTVRIVRSAARNGRGA